MGAKQEMEKAGVLTSYHFGENEVYKALVLTDNRAQWLREVEKEGLELVVWNAEKAKKDLKKAKTDLKAVVSLLDKYKEICPSLDDLRQMLADKAELDRLKDELRGHETFASAADVSPRAKK